MVAAGRRCCCCFPGAIRLSRRDPALRRRIAAACADDLDTPSGLVARLLTIARHLDWIERGFADPREHKPLEQEAAQLLRQ
jgi:hypothetical protein